MSFDNTMAGSIPGNGAINAGVPGPRAATAVAQPLVDRLPAEMRFCLFLIFYLTLCDFILKFFPSAIAVPLRYLPELLLYFTAFRTLWKRGKPTTFPFFWPILLCGSLMVFSSIKNGAPLPPTAKDFYLLFRLTAFAAILWNCDFKPAHIPRFLNVFFRLLIFQILVGLFELIGGSTVKLFFAAKDAASAAAAAQLQSVDYIANTGYLAGTLGHYNSYGTFMCLGMMMAMGMFALNKKTGYQVLAWAAGIASFCSLSRHTLISLAVALCLSFFFRFRPGTLALIFKRLLVVAVLVGIVAASSSGLRDSLTVRLQTIARGSVTSSNFDQNARLFMLVELTPLFLSSDPVFGQGAYQYPAGVSDPMEAHTGPQLKAAPQLLPILTFYLLDVVWLYYLGAYGLAGLFCSGLVYGTVLIAAFRLRKARILPEYTMLSELCIVATVIFILAGFFSAEMLARDTIPIFWCLAGMLLSIQRRYGLSRIKKSPLAKTLR